jgi:hypothetical protein
VRAELKRKVRLRAQGRCEYCHTSRRYESLPFHIEHIIAEQHGGPTTLTNLAMACAHCNAHKGPNLAGIDPRTGKITRLFNPRTDPWKRHFKWVGTWLVGQTPIGRATVRVLVMNDPLKVAARAALMEEGVFDE